MTRRLTILLAGCIAITTRCVAAMQSAPPETFPSRYACRADANASASPQEKDASEARRLLTRIADAIAAGDSRSIGAQLNTKVFLTLFTGESGYYSAEQTTYILRNFFQTHSAASFAFHNTNVTGESAFGVGTFAFTKRAQRGSAQVFISLAAGKQSWRITQITVAQR
jgi:hypothetical protein